MAGRWQYVLIIDQGGHFYAVWLVTVTQILFVAHIYKKCLCSPSSSHNIITPPLYALRCLTCISRHTASQCHTRSIRDKEPPRRKVIHFARQLPASLNVPFVAPSIEASINRLPARLLIDILLRVHLQRRCTLAMLLACKLWYHIITTTPHFWTDVRYFDGTPQALHAFNLFLTRSNPYLIDVSVSFHNINSFDLSRIARAISLAEQRCRILVNDLREHLFRVRTLEFSGYPAGIFPLPTLMPHLRVLSLTFLMNNRGILPVVDHLVHEGSPVESLAINSCLSSNQFLHVNPHMLRNLRLLGMWPRATGLPFLSMCSRLGRLRIELMEGDDGNTARGLEFPCLRTLFVYGRTNIFRAHFASLPQLNHLTVICGQTSDDQAARLQSRRFGEPLYPHSAWPAMPNLRTLTVDHFELRDLIPTLASSQLLIGLHLHGNRGFSAILRFLLAMPVRGVSHTASRAADGRILRPLPLLRIIRLWAVQESGIIVVSHDAEDEAKHILPLFQDLIVVRGQLRVELGAIQNDPRMWRSLWDAGDLWRGIQQSGFEAQRKISVIGEHDGSSDFERERCYIGEPSLPDLIPLV